ncbi:M20/M25/M40 family metallo-hydrolase [Sphingomicrobium astaxanthinifaciens]|uniref:M20/M25/M40 family metallo-hydrolase n=1 Tax=Sphingomicrobium astaxanthinifaciens TaxID=1227949 RepID=UPI001FCB71BF|nr:M20/M25/M40 family metallo-hydrolase [Sphingomicrobium astaxanthinifaciens]MCJ7420675.1 M20/M25/M40 family metallo-hydrolase [Sphingomicrobium astaxanthinifaciens]
MLLTAMTLVLAADNHHGAHHHEDHHQAVAARLEALSADVSEARLRADLDAMVGFGTRHTLSSQTDPERGIGAAVNWVLREMEAFGLEPVRVCDTATGPRIPEPTLVCSAVGIKRGTERPNDVVIYTAHLDSRVSEVMNSTDDAPGANDSASGVAGGLEAARLLAEEQFPGTIIIAALAGEEQGLVGARILADYAKAQGWNVIANLNNDMIGANCGSDGYCEPDVIRVFSEGPRRQGNDAAMRAAMHRLGGENDAPSRNLSRWLDALADRMPGIGLDVRQVWRTDRWGRGGDHIRFLEAGYPAVRVTVPVEDYDHQHQDLRTEDGVFYGDVIEELDFAYMAKATRLNTAALAALASAPPPPMGVEAEGAVQTDTTLRWQPVPSADHYKVTWRRTDAANWGADHRRVDPADCSAEMCEVVLEGIRVDDWMFGVASASTEHLYSPVVSAVPGGDFAPIVEEPRE